MLDPRAVDIMGDERDMLYTSDGKLTEAHLTVLYLTGSLASEMPAVNFGNTTNASSFTERLAGLMNAHPEVLVFANHPSNVQIISADDLLEAANANVLHVMEMERHAPLDITKWDYVLANLDDQAGDCNKIVWAICGHDMHYAERVDYRTAGAMLGMIPTVEQDPVYSDRRLAFADMIRRGSTVALAPDFRCAVPRYSLESLDGTAGSMNVSLQVDNIANASAVEMRFYGCDWETGSKPGTLLYSQRLTWDSLNSVTYHLTQTGEADGVPLTVQQKANIKYIRPVLAISNDVRTHSFLQPVRIKASGAWWDGPAVTLAGGHASVGPSPYPSGGTDTGIEIYFNTHSHTLNSDGDCAPSTVRRVYWDSLGMLDPTKPRFNIITDHNVRTPFPTPVSSVVVMREGVRLLGGFAGYETSVEQRDWLENPTVIDAQNQGRCIYSDGSCWTDERDAVIDGFIMMFVTKPKWLKDGTSITWSGAVVTAVFQDFFYVGSDDRAYGIRVEPTPHGLQAGKRVEIRGTMRTDNERLIEADEVEVCGTGVVNPVFVANRSVGGGDYGTLTGVGQEGIAGASGLNNIGMLIRTTGRVTYACDDFFYIDDGSALSDGSGHVGIRVLPYGLSIPAAGSYVEVTGISSCFRPDGDLRRLIRATAIESF